MGRGALEEMGTYPRHVLYFSRKFYLRQIDLFPNNQNFDPSCFDPLQIFGMSTRGLTLIFEPVPSTYFRRGRDVSSPAIWATKISSHFGDNNVAQMSRRLNGHICSHTPCALDPKCRSEAKRTHVPYGYASMLLLGEGSEGSEAPVPYTKYANLFKYIS